MLLVVVTPIPADLGLDRDDELAAAGEDDPSAEHFDCPRHDLLDLFFAALDEEGVVDLKQHLHTVGAPYANDAGVDFVGGKGLGLIRNGSTDRFIVRMTTEEEAAAA